MPRRDGRGPLGSGAMTGRGLGLCSGENFEELGFRAGLGRGGARGGRQRLSGRACGRGYGRRFIYQSTNVKDIDIEDEPSVESKLEEE